MCGIAGFVGQGESAEIERMIDSISYRGPDDRGTHVDGNFRVAQARLAIIDLSPAGHQPMLSRDESISLAFNGEIYNYRTHREALVKAGYPFRGHSDTEVVLALYEREGAACFKKLEGMFAIALHDRRTGTCFLVRDRLGEKPLYYGIFGDTLLFGSELKALLAHPLSRRTLSPVALRHYLAHEYVPTPLSIFEGIKKVRPGTYLRFEAGRSTEESFWDTGFLKTLPHSTTESEASRELDRLIHDSVAARLMSDVPIGVFLSGGLDSSTIAYYASEVLREQSAPSLKTFSVGFEEASFDESAYAREVAALIGAEHHEQVCSAKDALDLLPLLASRMDEPFADASLLPTALLSRFARKHVTVALGGDGSDELFLGYQTFFAHALATRYTHLPQYLHQLFLGAANLLPTSHRYLSFDFKVKRFLRGARLPLPERDQAWMGSFTPAELDELLVGSSSIDVGEAAREHFSMAAGDDLRRLSWLYARTYLLDDILVKVDRASMLFSLEVRAPFLDTALVEFAFALPTNLKLRRTTDKYLLRRLMQGKLPARIVHRPKKGFGVPIGAWLRGPLQPLLLAKLDEKRLSAQGIFQPAPITRLVHEHLSLRRDHRKALRTLLMFQLWYDTWYN